MKIINLPVSDLIPYENNPRINDAEAVDAVAASIKSFGFKVPVIIDKDKLIVAGHTRHKAAIKLGMDEVPCIVADDLTDEQIRKFRLVDNKTAEISKWDFEELQKEISEIQSIDMTEFGFMIEDISKFKKQVEQEKKTNVVICPRCGRMVI